MRSFLTRRTPEPSSSSTVFYKIYAPTAQNVPPELIFCAILCKIHNIVIDKKMQIIYNIMANFFGGSCYAPFFCVKREYK